jgi:hypothetical protein
MVRVDYSFSWNFNWSSFISFCNFEKRKESEIDVCIHLANESFFISYIHTTTAVSFGFRNRYLYITFILWNIQLMILWMYFNSFKSI